MSVARPARFGAAEVTRAAEASGQWSYSKILAARSVITSVALLIGTQACRSSGADRAIDEHHGRTGDDANLGLRKAPS
jgi:hypothetical protein